MPQIDVTPDAGFFSVLPHVSYKAWFAMAEFVDNAVQSYEANREKLIAARGEYKPIVDIRIDNAGKRLIVADNAAGISLDRFEQAMKVAAPPPDRAGLSEFGMGMKTAACWFGNKWSVRTSALGEPVERRIVFDIPRIIKTGDMQLEFQEEYEEPNKSYTIIKVWNMHQGIHGQTRSKLKRYLAEIYRKFLHEHGLMIFVDKEKLEYSYPEILEAPFYVDPTRKPQKWRKEVEFEFGNEDSCSRARGFVAIAKTMDKTKCGISLFRRDRLIMGEYGSYRPSDLLGASNDFASRRIFADISIEGLGASHTKDRFQGWESVEADFIEKLRQQISLGIEPLLSQARHFRSKEKSSTDEAKQNATAAAREAVGALTKSELVPELLRQYGAGEGDFRARDDERRPISGEAFAESVFVIEYEQVKYTIVFQEVTSSPNNDWLSISCNDDSGSDKKIAIELWLEHPFTKRFAGPDLENLRVLARLAIGLGIAEIASRDRGTKSAHNVRCCLNELLSTALAMPDL